MSAALPELLPFDEALCRVLSGAVRLPPEEISLHDAYGRFLATDVYASSPLPAFDYSAMDGYALRVSEVAGTGTQLPVIGESRTGATPTPLAPQSCMRIFTGAAVPAGADAVVMQERVRRAGDVAEILEVPEFQQNIRHAGEDLRRGDLALSAGAHLDAGKLGLLAALDQPRLSVSKRPRVTIICTGDELRAPGTTALPGTIPESNSVAVAAVARAWGAEVRVAPHARDNSGDTERAFRSAMASTDLLVTIGGVSVGDYDLVKPALEEAGATLDFWKVAMKPGKPLVWGRFGEVRILGLPGNPVSALVVFGLIGAPLLRAMQGAQTPKPHFRTVPLHGEIRHSPGREGFYRGRWHGDGVAPLSGQSSGATTSMAHADVLIRIPSDSHGVTTGENVLVLALRDL